MITLFELNKRKGKKMCTLDKILELLKSQGKKQKDLTDYLGLSKNSFSNWKSGDNTSYLKHIPKIATFLGVSADYLLGNNSTSSQPILSAHELKVILAYRSRPEMQAAVDRLLCIEQENNIANIGEDIATTLAAVPQSINKK